MAFLSRKHVDQHLPFPPMHNAYGHLDDSDDENTSKTTKPTSLNRKLSQIKSTSPAITIDLTNDSRKRVHTTAFSSPGDMVGRKRVKIEQQEYAHAARNASITLPSTAKNGPSFSPPLQRGTDSEHLRKAINATGVGSNERPIDPTNVQTPPQAVQPSSRLPRETEARRHSINTSSRPHARPSTTASEKSPSQLVDLKNDSSSNSAVHRKAPVVCGPFTIDDSEGDEDSDQEESRLQSLEKPSLSAKLDFKLKSTRLAAAHREVQLLESRTRREQAAIRKRDTPSSFGARGNAAQDHDPGMDIDAKLALQDRDVKAENDCRNDGLEIKVTSAKPASPFLENKPAIDPSSSRPNFKHLAPDVKPGKQADLLTAEVQNRRARNHVVDSKTGRFAPSPLTLHAVSAKRADVPRVDAQSWRAGNHGLEQSISEAAQDKKSSLQAHVKALDEKDRKSAEAMKAAEAKLEEKRRAREKMQEDHEKQVAARAEVARRSREKIEAQKKSEAEEEAKALGKEKEQRKEEQKRWEEKKREEDVRREALRKRRVEEEKEKSMLDDRQAALARLSAIRPHGSTTSKDSQQASSSGDTDVKTVAVKHRAQQQGLDFKDDSSRMAADAARKKVKEYEDRNAAGGLLQAKPKGQPNLSQREERIKAMAERNAKLSAAQEKADEDEDGLVLEGDEPLTQRKGYQPWRRCAEDIPLTEKERHDSVAPSPPSPTLPSGPQSLKSAAGQALLARSNAVPKHKLDNHSRRLGEITPEDAQLVEWRDRGMKISEILMLFDKNIGVVRSVDTIRKRYKQVKEALKDAGVDDRVLRLLAEGSDAAREKVNQAVHGVWPVVASVQQQQAQERMRDAKGHFLPATERPAADTGHKGGLALPKHGLPTPTNSFSFTATDRTLDHEDDPTTRPQVGGKTMNEEAYFHYLNAMHEVYENLRSPSPLPRSPSPMCEDDYCHFLYFVERREIRQEDLDDGYDFNECGSKWGICGQPFDNLSAANMKAADLVLLIPKEWKDTTPGGPTPDIDLQQRSLADGRMLFTTTWLGLGKVQYRVTRQVRAYGDGVLPRSKDGWAPKATWSVYERKVTKSGGDDLFAAIKETDIQKVVNDTSYTALDLANSEAIRHFVSLTFSPKSAHLTHREMEVQAVEERLEKELEEKVLEAKSAVGLEEEEKGKELDVCFRKEIESDDGREKVVVWVAKGMLGGPRNL